MAVLLVWPPGTRAQESSLEIATQSQVSREGEVTLTLTLRNNDNQPVFKLHPMFHFHHTMSSMPMVPRLDPGRSITFENKDHPPVQMVGSYPIVAKVHFREKKESKEILTRFHTGSFYYGEPMVSRIEGTIGAEVHDDFSLLKILLKNPSSAFKNVRLMLLLPPELRAEGFQGMKGLTIQSGEEKYIEVPVSKIAGREGGVYPVHLLVEYGEKVRHFSGNITGQIRFGSVFSQGTFWPQLLVFAFLTATLVRAFHKRFKAPESA